MRRLDSFKSSPDEPYDSLLNRMMDFIVAWEDVWQLEKETQRLRGIRPRRLLIALVVLIISIQRIVALGPELLQVPPELPLILQIPLH
jgi:hypothetical protein